MRAFIAIELSDEIRSSLTQLQSRLKYAGADVKWVEEKNIHLTLKFLGDIDDGAREKVTAVLEDVSKTINPLMISIKEIGAFPSLEYPRVVWAGLDKGAFESTVIAKKIDYALYGIGFKKETRPFAAHLTVGRVRSARNKKALIEKISALNSENFVSPGQTVDSIALFQSTLTPRGSIYTKLSEFHFD